MGLFPATECKTRKEIAVCPRKRRLRHVGIRLALARTAPREESPKSQRIAIWEPSFVAGTKALRLRTT